MPGMTRYIGSLREDQDIEKRLRFKGVTAVDSRIQEESILEAPVIDQLRTDHYQIDKVIVPESVQLPRPDYSPQKVLAKKPVAYSVMSRKVPIYSFVKTGAVKAKKGLVDSIESKAPEVKKETNIMLFVVIGVGVLGAILLFKKVR